MKGHLGNKKIQDPIERDPASQQLLENNILFM